MAGSSWYASTVVLLFLCGLAVQGFAEQAVEDDEVSLDDDMTGFRYTQLLSKDVLLSEPYYEEVECSEQYDPRIAGCSPTRCGRYSVDNFITDEEVDTLRRIVEKASAVRDPASGPTIMDINSGFIRDPEGLTNMYSNKREGGSSRKAAFTLKEYQTYETVFTRIRDRIKEVFNLEELWFTAPTFIARIKGDPHWRPKSAHDEYWHAHVDKNNTPHYDYSGLLYLSTYNEDFNGGKFGFIDDDEIKFIEPKRGRLLLFTAGMENLHKFHFVKSGERIAMSMWYTCDRNKEFSTFLDGKPHASYRRAKARGYDMDAEDAEVKDQGEAKRERRRARQEGASSARTHRHGGRRRQAREARERQSENTIDPSTAEL